MLETLELKDFAIVDELGLVFSPGLNVLTGETGAGKSILVDALALLVGERADTAMIRSGSNAALVQGIFQGHEVTSLSRRLVAGGRSTARIDGELVTVGELAERAGRVIAIHGQHASQALARAGEQRRQLDRLLSAKASRALEHYRQAYREQQQVKQALASLRQAERERARRLDVLTFQLDEIDAAELTPGEEEELTTRAESLRHAERIRLATGRSLDLLGEGDENALAALAEALGQLDAAGRFHPSLATLAGELRDAVSGVQAIYDELERFLDDFEADPEALEQIEARLVLLEKLKRKYGDSVEAVLAYREEAARERTALENAEADAAQLEEQLQALSAVLDETAAEVSAARQTAAATLSERVVALLRELGMADARFEVVLEPTADYTPFGREQVSFLFSANLGEPPAPLSAVASGGELSRVMLALNVVTGSDRPILVFDEVDAGIGGKTARKVGALLKEMSARHQVLVVTHLPQVAAFADAQFFVTKEEKQGRTVTRVRRLEADEREAELARMLSGAVTDASLNNARELLQEAAAG